MRSSLMRALAVVAVIFASTGALWADGPCDPILVRQLREAVIESGDEFDEFLAPLSEYSETAMVGLRGMLTRSGNGGDFYRLFDKLELLRSMGRNPFSNDQELFEVVGHLLERQPQAVPGSDGVVRNVLGPHQEGFYIIEPQGALYELFSAKKIADERGSYSAIAGFQVRADTVLGVRRHDIIDDLGIRYEVKSWTSGFPPSDGSYLHFLAEMRKDIVYIDDPAGYRLIVHRNAADDAAEIKEAILAQFDDPEVISALGANLARDRKVEWQRALDADPPEMLFFH